MSLPPCLLGIYKKKWVSSEGSLPGSPNLLKWPHRIYVPKGGRVAFGVWYMYEAHLIYVYASIGRFVFFALQRRGLLERQGRGRQTILGGYLHDSAIDQFVVIVCRFGF